MNLHGCVDLKELPDLSVAINIERLYLSGCLSLIEIPSSIENLHKLESLEMVYTELRVVPTHFNLASLKSVDMMGCWQLRKIPDISRNFTSISIEDTMLEDLFGSIRLWSRLRVLSIVGSVKPSPDLGLYQNRRGPDIEKIPDCIKDLPDLEQINIYGCPKLASLPQLPRSLRILSVENNESLETLIPFEYPIELLNFNNFFKLGEEARRVIIQQSVEVAWLPGRNIPAEFNHQAIGNSLTIPLDVEEFKICLVISPKQQMVEDFALLFRLSIDGIFTVELQRLYEFSDLQAEHLCIQHIKLPLKVDCEIILEFSTSCQDIDIIDCSLQILRDKSTSSQGSNESRLVQLYDSKVSKDLTWCRRIKKNVLLCLISGVFLLFFV